MLADIQHSTQHILLYMYMDYVQDVNVATNERKSNINIKDYQINYES